MTNYGLKICAVLALAFSSCAEIEQENAIAVEQEIFDAWMSAYVPTGVVRQPNGMYVEFLADGDQNIEAGCDTIVWLRLEYTSKDLHSNVFATRSEDEARRQRSFTPHTFYEPEYVRFDRKFRNNMTSGRHYALGNDLFKSPGGGDPIKLTEGSRVRLYMPAHLAWGARGYSNNKGYGGQYALDAGKPIVEELQVVKVVKDPHTCEQGLVEAQAIAWNGVDTLSVDKFLFVDTLAFNPGAELLARFPQKPFEKQYGLTVDSVAKIWYIGRFLPTTDYPDGFIFDTNIESVYSAFFNRRAGYLATARSSYDVMSYKPSSNKNSTSFISAFYKVIPHLRRGQWSRIVFTSSDGYGANGYSSGNTVIQSYTPLIFEIYIETE